MPSDPPAIFTPPPASPPSAPVAIFVQTTENAALPSLLSRQVREAGEDFFEVGFAVEGMELRGNATAGWHDRRKQYWFRLEWSKNLTDWFQGFFLPCATPAVTQDDGSVIWWSRSQFPIRSDVSSNNLVAYHPAPDARDNPITAIHINTALVALSYPYTLPTDLTRLQLDLRGAGFLGALCQAVGDTGWQISIPSQTLAAGAVNDVRWAEYVSGTDPLMGGNTYSSGITFGGGAYNAAGVATNLPKQFVRLAVAPFHKIPPGNPLLTNYGQFYQSQLLVSASAPVDPNPAPPVAATQPSAAFTAFAAQFSTAVDSRLAGKTPAAGTRNVLSTKDHTAPSYVRNAGLWCADMASSLTGVVMFKPAPTSLSDAEAGGGVAITSRHLLGCRHWHSNATHVMRFVLADGTAVERTILRTAEHATLDLSVWLLDSALPAGVRIARCMPALTSQQQQFMVDLQVPDICQCQGTGLSRPAGWQNAGGTLPATQEHMIYPGAAYLGFSSQPTASRLPWWHSPYPGDSGTPRFLCYGSEALLYAITSGATIGENIASINALITACDDAAIAAGVISARTNLSITVAPLTIPAA